MTRPVFASHIGKSEPTIEKYESELPDDLVGRCVQLALEHNLIGLAEELNPALRDPKVFAPEHGAYHQMFELVLRDADEREAAIRTIQAFWQVTVDKAMAAQKPAFSEEELLLVEAFRSHAPSKKQLDAVVAGQKKRGQARGVNDAEKTAEQGRIAQGVAQARLHKSGGTR